jgi:hypothetical protein
VTLARKNIDLPVISIYIETSFHTRTIGGTMSKNLAFIFILTLVFASPAAAEDYTAYTDKAGFKISYPKKWKIDATMKDFNIAVANEAGTAMIGVRVDNLGKVVEPVDFLNAVERTLKAKNLLEPGERPIEDGSAKALGADKACMGVFMVGSSETPIRQMYYIFSKGTKMFTLIFTFVESEKEQYRQISKDVLKSFRITQ